MNAKERKQARQRAQMAEHVQLPRAQFLSLLDQIDRLEESAANAARRLSRTQARCADATESYIEEHDVASQSTASIPGAPYCETATAPIQVYVCGRLVATVTFPAEDERKVTEPNIPMPTAQVEVDTDCEGERVSVERARDRRLVVSPEPREPRE